jgi:large subunit ribosomal protein L29
MKIAELRMQNNDDLRNMLLDFKKEAFTLRFRKFSGDLQNTSRIGYIRKVIAKINTVLNERKNLGGANA